MLTENPSADFGPGYYSDTNLKFTTSVLSDLFDVIPTKSLNAAESGIKKLTITLSDEAERSLLEKEYALMKT
jgi:hypothetical protein